MSLRELLPIDLVDTPASCIDSVTPLRMAYGLRARSGRCAVCFPSYYFPRCASSYLKVYETSWSVKASKRSSRTHYRPHINSLPLLSSMSTRAKLQSPQEESLSISSSSAFARPTSPQLAKGTTSPDRIRSFDTRSHIITWSPVDSKLLDFVGTVRG